MRRLAAIVATDVVGYSRHMAEAEAATLEALKAAWRDVLDPAIARHSGRVVKLMGDGALVEFTSIVAAVECSVAIQRAMAARNAVTSIEPRLRLRIGINLGDVIVEANAEGVEDIFGDGVNIAARLQEVAEPGGIAVSHTVVSHVRNKVALAFTNQGERTLKNIDEPVTVHTVRLDDTPDATSRPEVVLNRPAVAIMPFHNMSGDAAQEYFADGITEDLITALSAWRWFPVIARNSTFAFKSRAVDATHVGRTLGARYVVEGTVQRAGDRVRIGAKLVDAASAVHLWAQSYDRRMGDVFDLQDEITRSIVGAIEPELARAEQQRAQRKRPENLDGWDLSLQALAQIRKGTPAALKTADELLVRAVAMNPGSSYALSLSALARFQGALAGWTADPARALASTHDAAVAAVAVDDGDWLAHALLGIATLWNRRDFEKAIAEEETAVALNPSAAIAYHFYGCVLTFGGRAADAIPRLDAVLRLDPRFPFLTQTLADIGLARLLSGDCAEAVRMCERALAEHRDNVRAWQRMASAKGHLGMRDEAAAALGEVYRLFPEFGPAYVAATYPFRNPSDAAMFAGGLRRAGWTG